MDYRKPSLRIAAVTSGLIIAFNASIAPLCLSWLGETRDHRATVELQLTSLRKVLELVVEAETAQRGYIITGDENFLQPYYATKELLPVELENLNRLYSSVTVREEKKIAPLLGDVRLKMDNLASTLQLRREEGYESVMPVVRAGRGKQLMDKVRRDIDQLTEQELQETTVLDRQMMQKAVVAVVVSLTGTLLTFCLLGWLFSTMRRAVWVAESSAIQAADVSLKLEVGIASLEQRNAEISLLGQMSHLLQTEMSLDEGLEVTARYCQLLLPKTAGAVYLYRNSADLLEPGATWGDLENSQSNIAPQACWALRRGQAHEAGSHGVTIPCKHSACMSHNEGPRSQLCLPLIAYGEILGMLHLTSMEPAFTDPQRDIAKAIGEQAALALSNVKLRAALHDRSIRDPLTGLFNRRFMEETLERELARAKRGQVPLSLIMVDLDHFKRVNDHYGHAAGDAVLRATARLISQTLRLSDTACRYGGEELVLILPDCSSENAVKRARQLCDAIRAQAVTENGQTLFVTGSFGVSSTELAGSEARDLIRLADKALYQAKANGRDRVVEAGSTELPENAIG
ncbi:diguanylate cyclase [Pseudomonas sp. Marseille-Q5115]|uniref:diguanylate cyclase n=1 Tax=Pseudomonas sp. Marseille-Q5115 TaxID=2866593 RepID=UPI001CE413CB|nr:diguanylate cyclase [Pseudomonas sp. Marseille-Q5115]